VKKHRRVLKGYSLAMQISGTMLFCVFCSLFSGIWLDKKFQTAPCIMLVFIILGFAMAMYNTYRIVQEEAPKT
jgi:F0F1-type ATP synthase assembly protein I